MFYDLDDNPLTSAEISITSAETILMYFKIDCLAGKKLYAVIDGIVDELSINIQFDTSGWVDAIADGLDLTPFNATKHIVIVEIIANNISNLLIENIIWKIL